MKRLTKHEIENLVENKGGKLLSNKYINNCSPLKVMCAMGHEWHVNAHNLKQGGTWCPTCDAEKKRKRNIERRKDISDIKKK